MGLNILLTSVGRRSYLVKYFKEALAKEKIEGQIFAANSSSLSTAFLEADGTIVTPLIYDDSYISSLLTFCKKNNVQAVMSLFDIDIPMLAKNKRVFESNGIQVLVVDYDMAVRCNDKYAMVNMLDNNGISVPKTYITIDDAISAIAKNELRFPVIIKPRWGCGSISIHFANSIEEMKVLYGITLRDINDSYLKYESSQSIDNAIIIQEVVQGDEYGLDVINDIHGNYINTIIKKKIAMRSGETDCAKTVVNEQLRDLGHQIAKVTRHPVIVDVDVILQDNQPLVLDINARFGGGYPFSHLAGVDLPRAVVRWLSGKDECDKFCKAKSGIIAQKDIQMVQYDMSIIKEMENE